MGSEWESKWTTGMVGRQREIWGDEVELPDGGAGRIAESQGRRRGMPGEGVGSATERMVGDSRVSGEFIGKGRSVGRRPDHSYRGGGGPLMREGGA